MKKNQPNNTPDLSPIKRLGILFLNFVLFYAIYALFTELGERMRAPWIFYAISIVYAVSASALFIAYFILNGFTFNKEPRVWDELPEKWDDSKKNEFMSSQPERKAKAKKLLYILMPIVLTLMINYILLIYF